VFVHVVGVSIWTGALLPLGLLLLGREKEAGPAALARFSAMIPYAVAPLVLAGILLAVIQVGTPEALVTTGYGLVLLAKAALLVPLFALAAINRLWLTRPALAGDALATRRLAASVAAEIVLVAVILAVVALWRFTPPPRSLAAAIAPSAMAHLHSEKAMALVTITPGQAGPVTVSVTLAAADGAALVAKEVTLTFTNAPAGIEPIRRGAILADGTWRSEGMTLPVSGQWTVRVAALITDFDQITVEGTVEIAP
jgi:copper transport protein